LPSHRTLVVIAVAAVAATILAGCRAEEEAHPLIIEKGTYTGAADTTLSASQLSELKSRAVLQGAADSTGGPGGFSGPPEAAEKASSEPAAKGPANSSSVPESALADRMRMQSGK